MLNKIKKMDVQKTTQYWLMGAEKDWLACQHLYENNELQNTLRNIILFLNNYSHG